MHTYEPNFFSRPTILARAVRGAVGVAIAGIFVAAWSTAGPGNYDRSPVVRVALPAVAVVARRDAAQPAAATVVGCERSQLDAGRGARKLG